MRGFVFGVASAFVSGWVFGLVWFGVFFVAVWDAVIDGVGVVVGVTVADEVIDGVGVGVFDPVGVGVGDNKKIGQVGVGVGICSLPQASAEEFAKAPIKETFFISKLQENEPVEKLIPGNKIDGFKSQVSPAGNSTS